MEAPIQTPRYGPIAAWSFDEGEAGGETVTDLTGGEHEGTIEGATRTNGRYGEALSFDGTGDCVTVPAATDLELREELTVEAWVKPEGTGEAESIIFKEAEGGWFGYSLFLGLSSSGKVEGLIANDPETETAPTVYTPVVEPNVWTHVALTYDGRHERIYMDGKLEESKITDPPNPNNGDLKIGCVQEGEAGFDGKIDEVRVYERSLNGVEVQQTMNATFPKATTEAATEPDANDAMLTGVANANGGATEYYFEYGPTTSYGETVMGEELGIGREEIEVSEVATRLAPETTYHYRLVAAGLVGTAHGKDQSFTTGTRVETVEEEAELEEKDDAFELTKKAKEGVPTNFYGMMWSGDLSRMASKGIYKKIEESGAKILRLLVVPGAEKQPAIEEAVQLAANHELRVLPYFGGNAFPKFGTKLRTNWINYARKLVEEYGPGGSKKYKYPITSWEIWNEPNMPFPGAPNNSEGVVNPKAFALFLKEMSESIRSGAGGEGPNLTILAPGLFGYKANGCGPNCHQTPQRFLNRVNDRLKALEKPGDESVYDAVSVHPYVFTVGLPGNKHAPLHSAEVKAEAQAIEQSIASIHRVAGNKPVWVTEVGFPVEQTTNSTAFPTVSTQVQKALVGAVFSAIQNARVRLDVAHMFYWNIQDQEIPGWDWHCGLLTYGGQEREAFGKYQEFAK
jgi:hypothetical protein